jgi:hypothetical protein
MPMLMRFVVATAAALALSAAATAAGAHAGAKGCHGQAATQLYLSHGISGVRAERVRCRRAVRALARWARDGMPGSGPAGWRCRPSRLNPDAERVRCSRRAQRLRFDVGGGR